MLWRFRRLFFLLGLLLVGLGAGAVYVVARVPLPPEEIPAQTTFVYAADGSVIAELHGGEDREAVSLDRVPRVLVDAVLAAEDRDFFSHPGIDLSAIARATWTDLRRGGAVQGGSTITQQYVKNVYVGTERTVWRKLREAVMAVKLERKLEKEEILERYLNTIYLGRGAHGVQAAARAYFGKDVAGLDLAEAAYLAGLIRAPEAADATRDPTSADARRDGVLGLMEDAGFIEPSARRDASAAPVAELPSFKPRPSTREVTVAGCECGLEYFIEHVRQELSVRYGDAAVFGGGLRVTTTVDIGMQRAAYDAVYGVLDRPDDPAAALVALDESGHVRAMVGGRDWSSSKVNFALGKAGGGTGRQAGSAFKPFVLAEAVKQGFSVESAFESPSRVVLPRADSGKDYPVTNYGRASHGRINLIDATRLSSNTVYAQLIQEVGPENVAVLARRMGITSDVLPVVSTALGTSEVSVLDMADAYLTLATRGEHVQPLAVSRVTTARGTVLDDFTARRERVLDPDEADVVTFALRQVVDRGTGTGARFGRAAAGKTGTTQDYGDAWFVGYTPRLVAAVWLGYPESRRPMDAVHGLQVTGGSLPADIWRRFMVAASRSGDMGRFVTPSSFPGQVLNGRIRFGEGAITATTTEPPPSTTSSSPASSSTSSTEQPDSSSTSTSSTTPGSSTSTTAAPTSSTVVPGGRPDP